MKGLNEYLNEKVNYQTDVKNFKDLMKAIDKLPDTIEEISVPVDLKVFASQSKKIKPSKSKNWRKEVQDTLKKTLKDKASKDLDTFSLKSYFGTLGNPDTSSYYVQLSSKGKRDFGDAMSKDGSLD